MQVEDALAVRGDLTGVARRGGVNGSTRRSRPRRPASSNGLAPLPAMPACGKTSPQPLVSIIITNYNYAPFVTYAVESALGQTYPRLEVILVDDGSTDTSREVTARYLDRITPIFKENGGQASAFNAGFAQSHGEVVIFLDADDVLLPEITQHVVNAFSSGDNVSKVMYRMGVIDREGRRTSEVKPLSYVPRLSGDVRRYILNFPYDTTWMATSGNAFSSACLRRIFPIPEQSYIRIYADWYVSHLTPLLGNVLFLSDIGALYRVHGSNNYVRTYLNLNQVRSTIPVMSETNAFINEWSVRLGLKECYSEIDSVSYIGARMISIKLDPRQHPVAGDTTWSLLKRGIAASRARFDASPAMRAAFALWFLAMALAPRQSAVDLSTKFYFPERRGWLNCMLALLRR